MRPTLNPFYTYIRECLAAAPRAMEPLEELSSFSFLLLAFYFPSRNRQNLCLRVIYTGAVCSSSFLELRVLQKFLWRGRSTTCARAL